jgi:hypothetical protein
MRKLPMLVLLAGQLVASTAIAQSTYYPQYATIGLGVIRGGGVTLTRAVASYGVNIGPNFSLEGQLSRGRDSDEEAVGGAFQRINSGWGYGAFALARIPLGSRGGDIFFRAGYEDNRLTGSVTGTLPRNVDMRGFSYGIGFNLFSGPGGGVRMLYSRIGENEARALTISYRLQF